MTDFLNYAHCSMLIFKNDFQKNSLFLEQKLKRYNLVVDLSQWRDKFVNECLLSSMLMLFVTQVKDCRSQCR